MPSEKAKRKLTAVLHADVKGFSRLMGEDEETTVKTLATCKDEMVRLVPLNRGRVVDTAGDGFLLEFASVLDAVGFALEFQEEIKNRNIDVPETRRMEFRIGINVGDVIADGDKIYGDGPLSSIPTALGPTLFWGYFWPGLTDLKRRSWLPRRQFASIPCPLPGITAH